MKKRIFWSGLLIVFLLFLILINSKENNMTSVTRPYIEGQYAIIDDSQVPLSATFDENSLEIKTMAEINKIRDNANLTTLTYSNGLTQAALTRAEECDKVFSHTRPNGSDWYTVEPAIMYGENLAEGYDNAEDLTTAWMNSPTHRELILDKEYQTCGIGSYTAADGSVYVACEFGY